MARLSGLEREQHEQRHKNCILVVLAEKRIFTWTDFRELCIGLSKDPLNVVMSIHEHSMGLTPNPASFLESRSKEETIKIYSEHFMHRMGSDACMFCDISSAYGFVREPENMNKTRKALLDILGVPYQKASYCEFLGNSSGLMQLIRKKSQEVNPKLEIEFQDLALQREFAALLGEENVRLERRVAELERLLKAQEVSLGR